jgi:CheY-like chemotaxis protein
VRAMLPKTVLVVEDDVLIGLMLCDMVRDLGLYPTGPIGTLEEGMARATGEKFDFALLDFDLGQGTDSIPIAETLAARNIPFAFATGSDPEVVHRSFSQRPVISKPVVQRELEQVLLA